MKELRSLTPLTPAPFRFLLWGSLCLQGVAASRAPSLLRHVYLRPQEALFSEASVGWCKWLRIVCLFLCVL